MKTNDRQLTELMKEVDSGAAQLPDFQRGWVWDDGRIRALILSVIHNFPVGAAMFLEYGNESIHFNEYLTRWGPGLLRLGAIMSFGGYCVSRPGLLRLGAVVG